MIRIADLPAAPQPVRPVHFSVVLESECAFMTGLSAGVAAPGKENVVITVRETETPHTVYGLPVVDGRPVALFEAKVGPDNGSDAPRLFVRDLLPPPQGLGVSDLGPWISKTQFSPIDLPYGLRAPLFLQGQGKLGYMMIQPSFADPGRLPDPPVVSAADFPEPVVRPPRSALHSLIRSFRPTRFVITVTVVALLVAGYLLVSGSAARRPRRARSPADYDESSEGSERSATPPPRRRRRREPPPQESDDDEPMLPDSLD